jgi:hypothetical protein
MPLTPSEEAVATLCRRSFLSLWSVANPQGRNGKELCDVLVVCGADVVLISVKDIALKNTGKVRVDWARWRRAAIEESVKQLYGAERVLSTLTRVKRADGSPGVALPPAVERRVHRVAVALGGHGSVLYEQGDFDKGYVHVLDDVALPRILDYLRAKEALHEQGVRLLMDGQEEDLLAYYIHEGRKFPTAPTILIVGDDWWETVTKKPEWIARKQADRESYVWDGLIETLLKLNDSDNLTATDALDSIDGVLRVMARETRFSRRLLAAGFNEFMRDAAALKTSARIMQSPSEVRYVFLACARDSDREDRRRELELRCFVARGLMVRGDTVIGIATERYAKGEGFSLDAVRITRPAWGPKDQQILEGIQRDFRYFVTPRMTQLHGDEFPCSDSLSDSPPPAEN